MNYVKDLTQDYTETLLYYLYINDYESSNDSHNRITNLLKVLFRYVGNKNNVLMIKNKNVFKKLIKNMHKYGLNVIYDDKYYKVSIVQINRDIIVYLSYINFEDNEYESFIFFEKKLETKMNRFINEINN